MRNTMRGCWFVPLVLLALPAIGQICQVPAGTAANALSEILQLRQLECFGGSRDQDVLSARIVKETTDAACGTATRPDYDEWRRKLARFIQDVDSSLPPQGAIDDPAWRDQFLILSGELKAEADLIGGSDGIARPIYWDWKNHDALQGRNSRHLIGYKSLVESDCSTGADACKEAVGLAIRMNRAVNLTNIVGRCAALPRGKRALESLVKLDKDWNHYFFETRSQYIWELAVNSARYHDKQDVFGEPPTDQIILLHPGVTFEYLGGGARHEEAYQAVVMAEVIGYNKFTWKERSPGVPSRLPPLGASIVATLAKENTGDRIGYGLMIHVYNTLSIGATRRDTGAGTETTWLLSADLMKLILNPSAEAVAKFRGKGNPAPGVSP